MDTLTAGPRVLKQANLSLIRNVIKRRGTVTRAELAMETNISSTTVRSLLTDMMQDGEIECIGYDESSGGRKAKRYTFKTDRYYCVAFCILEHRMYGMLVNIWGEVLEKKELSVQAGDFETAVTAYLDGYKGRKEIKSIGIGVPGVVEGGGYWKKLEADGTFVRLDLGERLARRYRLPVVMENDLRAMAIGFERSYEKKFPCETAREINMAYLNFQKSCISAGFIAEGLIVHGNGNFAGELGLIPMENGKLLDECLAEPMDDAEYIRFVLQILCLICGILNPQYIVMGGPGLRLNCVGSIREGLQQLLPEHMSAEVLYTSDLWQDYHNGMAYLAAGRMFDEVSFVKEFKLL